MSKSAHCIVSVCINSASKAPLFAHCTDKCILFSTEYTHSTHSVYIDKSTMCKFDLYNEYLNIYKLCIRIAHFLAQKSFSVCAVVVVVVGMCVFILERSMLPTRSPYYAAVQTCRPPCAMPSNDILASLSI